MPYHSPSTRGRAPRRPSNSSRLAAAHPDAGLSVTLNIPVLLATMGTGVLTWLIAATIYLRHRSTMPSPALMGLLLAVLALGLAVVVCALSNALGLYEDNIVTGSIEPVSVFVALAVLTAAAFGAGALFQWLYSLGVRETARDLINARGLPELDWLYGILRVIFYALLGGLMGLISAVGYGRKDATAVIILSAMAQGFAGGLILELGTGVFHWPEATMWFIAWMLLATRVAMGPGGVKGKTSRPRRRSSRRL